MQARLLLGAVASGLMLLAGAGCSPQNISQNGSAPLPANKSEKAFTYEAFNFGFQSPVELQVKDVGAVPGTAVSAGIMGVDGKLKLNAVFSLIDETTRQVLNKEQAFQDAKATYLGIYKPATEHPARVFFGRQMAGDKQTTAIPAPATAESYLVETPQGQWLFVGVKYHSALPADEAEKIISLMAATLKENPKL